ncbi:MAG: ABC transporter permease [Chloroflexota bacterium]
MARVWVVATFTFFLIRLMPGDPAKAEFETLVQRGIPEEQARAQVADMFGFVPHDPVPLQYAQYLWRLVHLDLGSSSSFSGVSVSHIIWASLPWTLFLVTAGLFVTFVIGVIAGVVAAVRRDSWIGTGISLVGSILHGIPQFMLALILLYFFYTRHQIFSSLGPYDPEQVNPGANLSYLLNLGWHSILPIAAFALSGFGFWALAMKSSVVSTLGDDFILASELRGIKPSIRFRYIARNAFLPLFTVLAISLGYTFGGSIFIEKIFVYPGVGKMLNDSVNAHDFPLMEASFLIITIAVIISNILADILYSVIDPRIRTQ